MSHRKAELEKDLKALGIQAGDTVLMHSSYKSLGGPEDGAKGFFEVFLDVLTDEGTLVLPTLSYQFVTLEQTCFDIDNTPSCSGYLTEYFRTEVEDTVRSFHATHSCTARGKYAEFLTKDHEKDCTPVGKNSPFYKLPQVNGKILMLGCHPHNNTSMHGVEETAEPFYLFDHSKQVIYTMKNHDGSEIQKPSLRHWFGPGHVYAQRYERILDLLSDEEKKYGKVLDADCVIMDAKAVWEKGHEMLLKNPTFFVDRQW